MEFNSGNSVNMFFWRHNLVLNSKRYQLENYDKSQLIYIYSYEKLANNVHLPSRLCYLLNVNKLSLSFLLSFFVLRFEGVREPARWNGDDFLISIPLGMALSDDDDDTRASSSILSPGLKNCAEFERISGDKVLGLYASTNALTSRENIWGAMAWSLFSTCKENLI